MPRTTIKTANGLKKRSIIVRLVTWITILIVITMVSFMVIKDRFSHIEQWTQAKYDFLEKIGLKPNSEVALHYMPIADKVLLIPKYQGLKQYTLSDSNKKVGTIWLELNPQELFLVSPENNIDKNRENLFASKDKILIIIQQSPNQIKDFSRVPHSILDTRATLLEEPSDQKNQGFRRFHRLFGDYQYTPEEAKNQTEISGKELVLHTDGKYYHLHDQTDYILVKEDRVKYFMTCNDIGGVIKKSCYLYFPWGDIIMMEIVFARELLPYAVVVAEKIKETLQDFETNGRIFQKSFPEIQEPRVVWARMNKKRKLYDFGVDKPAKESIFVRWVNIL